MSQNTSHAVMAQRVEAHDSLDDFPTQPWGTRALMEHVIVPLALQDHLATSPKEFLGSVWEPACNRGYMARPLREYFKAVIATDIFDYGWDGMACQGDFLFPPDSDPILPDWVITNPPFRLAEQFITKARAISRVGCAMLVRTSFLESVGRYNALFKGTPPTIAAIFTERLPMVKGRVDQKASTATSYSWLVWVHDVAPKPLFWIPPCRKQLERLTDYPEAA